MIYSPYHNQKIKRYDHKCLSAIYIGANKSRRRTITFGTLITLGWIIGVLHLPPLAKAKTVYPHLGMMALATGVVSITKKNYTNALSAQQECLSLLKKLRTSSAHQEIESIHIKTRKLAQKYPHYFETERFHE